MHLIVGESLARVGEALLLAQRKIQGSRSPGHCTKRSVQKGPGCSWLAERYHSTDDDLNQPVDLAAAAQFNSFFADLALAVADEPGRPHCLESSFFDRFETAR